MPKLSIITVTYNSSKQISTLLDSIADSKDKLSKEVIIVDNASQDNSAEIVAGHKSRPTLIRSSTNVGFSKAVNLGLKQSTGDYILLLNPDTQLVGDCLTTLINFAEKTNPLGAVAPKLLNPDGKPQASIFKFPTILNAFKKNFFGCTDCFGKYLPTPVTQKVDVAIMAAFLIPRATIDKIGGLNEKYFLYYEDFDFCRKLKQAKLPVYYLPSAKVKHVHGASGNFTSHFNSPLLASSKLYYGESYSTILNAVLWIGHKWQVILRGKKFRD